MAACQLQEFSCPRRLCSHTALTCHPNATYPFGKRLTLVLAHNTNCSFSRRAKPFYPTLCTPLHSRSFGKALLNGRPSQARSSLLSRIAFHLQSQNSLAANLVLP